MDLKKRITHLLNPITKAEDLDVETKRYKQTLNEVKRLDGNVKTKSNEVFESAVNLYESRKLGLKEIYNLDSYIHSLSNCPVSILRGVQRAISFSKDIAKAQRIEEEKLLMGSVGGPSTVAGSSVIIGGTVAGTSVAVAGPTAAMAIATTFGTAGTGTAISTLGGAAATNAALAWLGGGTLAAGGAGVAGGSLIVSLLAPIGGIIAGVAIVGGMFIIGRKRSKAIMQYREERKKIDRIIHDLKRNYQTLNLAKSRMEKMREQTTALIGKISCDDYVSRGLFDFQSDNFPKSSLYVMVDNAKLLGKLSQEPVDFSTCKNNIYE